jgi:hypothetical protein
MGLSRLKATKKNIPKEAQIKIDEIVKEFNEKVIRDKECFYVTRYKGNYLYLNRYDPEYPSPICRLKYTGNIKDWDFAIFKYSSEQYDSEEWFFPGSDEVDGTIEGAMRAGLEAYPCNRKKRRGLRIIKRIIGMILR